MADKWQMKRAGVLNFWYYDDEEFDFANGRLLLRGSNGSGKSVTMQSLITVLLDGVKSPDRLDSFGSRSRRMEDYLLGEKEIVNRDERTGYLYLEYKKTETDRYMTTGIGLHAKRSGGIDFWGFAIENRRIGKDFFLYKPEISAEDGSEQKIPLTRLELERQIGTSGQVVRTQKDYMELVNRHIFGFEHIEQFQELMKLLIQLRSPKLSKDFKPSVIYEILNESLPSLSDEELRTLSDTMESMERIKLQIEQMERDGQALSRLCRQYTNYNEYILVEKADLVQRAERRLNKSKQDGKELARQLERDKALLVEKGRSLTTLERERAVLEVEKGELEKHDVFQMEQQKQEKEIDLAGREQDYTRRTSRLSERQKAERQEHAQVVAYESQLEAKQSAQAEHLTELSALSEEADFAAHNSLQQSFAEKAADFTFRNWRQNSQAHLDKLAAGLDVLQRQRATRLRRDQIDKELGEERRQLDEYRADERRLEQRFMGGQEQLLEEAYRWQKEFAADLPLEKEEMRRIAQAIQGLYDAWQWKDVQAPIDEAYGRQVNRINEELGLTNAAMREAEKAEHELLADLKKWQDEQDPEPERLADVCVTRLKLAQQGIAFVPFYAAVEFNESVTPVVRERIEAALTDMGLVDALIVPPKDLAKLDDESYGTVFWPQPQIMAHTLADYLKPTPPHDGQVTVADIDEVLRSIIIDDSGTWRDDVNSGLPTLSVESGVYRVAVLAGRAPRRDSAIYIGKQARQEFRRKQMELLQEKLQKVALRLEDLYAAVKKLQLRKEKNQSAREQFPSDGALRIIYHDLQAVVVNISRQQQRVTMMDERLKVVNNELLALRSEWQMVSAGIKVVADEDGYKAAIAVMREYQQVLHALELCWQGIENSGANARQARSRLEDICSEVDILKGELLVQEEQLQRIRLELSRLEERLQAMGAEELRERSRLLTKRLLELPALSKELITGIAKLEVDIDFGNNRLGEQGNKIEWAGKLLHCWRQLWEQELKLGLVYRSEESITVSAVLQEKSFLLKADRVDRTGLSDRLNKSFVNENNVLMEYRMQLEPLTAKMNNWPELPSGFDEDGGLGSDLEKLREKAQRVIITLDYEGRRQNPYQLQRALVALVEDQRSVLSDKDKELYEEVIMNNIGRIISDRIRSAQRWVEKMNVLMQQRENSSGLRFKLEWKARTAERDEEMDTQDLVRLLHADPATLKEEDLKKMVAHFQSRIEQAKQASMGTAGAEATFQQAVKQLLDYRLWFQFKLYYEQVGLTWRELSDKLFFKFSGGEKAMAMYIPLFSAAYSRYQEARSFAPYIITLDEAFAGVDEHNIRDTFALVEQLGFNYIMNSQSLWGDYDVVPALSICELIRPQNAPYVTVVRYYWNGMVRSLQVDEDYDEDEGLNLAAATGKAVT